MYEHKNKPLRYEKKYKIEHLSKAYVLQALRMHPAAFRKLYPDRTINNIYFDTPNLTTYHQNVAGIADRKKFRVRWYGEEITQIEAPQFEIKFKQAELGGKHIQKVDSFQLDDLEKLTKEINKNSQTDALLQPVLINSYRRAYYATSNQKFRITIDTDLRYCPLLKSKNFNQTYYSESGVVLELKYALEDDQLVDFINQFLPFRQTKKSKYVTGMMSAV
ncbi:MAG: polyphosphate polymerase domain-containing protein [Chitinophagales bacterium]